jgi:hypothetical protein
LKTVGRWIEQLELRVRCDEREAGKRKNVIQRG